MHQGPPTFEIPATGKQLADQLALQSVRNKQILEEADSEWEQTGQRHHEAANHGHAWGGGVRGMKINEETEKGEGGE